MPPINIITYDSACGTLLLGEADGRLCMCDWTASAHYMHNIAHLHKLMQREFAIGATVFLADVTRQLDEYFAGTRQDFDIPLLLVGTEFRKTVWHGLLSVPYGQTISYSDLACRIGRPSAVRAVANAVGANPISIIVPCHRIIGTSGTLTGYAGGLPTKKHLLALEK